MLPGAKYVYANSHSPLLKPIGPDSQSGEGQKANITTREDHERYLEADSSSAARLSALDEERGSNIALASRTTLAGTILALLLVGSLFMVVVPGVVVGVLMKQVLMGIVLSGTIATVIGTCAGFYYYHSKEVC